MNFISSIELSTFGKIVVVVLAIAVLAGIYFLVTGIVSLASRKTRKTVKKYKAVGKEKKGSSMNAVDDGLQNLSKRFVPYIKMNSIARSEKEKALRISGMSYTPEEYMAYMLTVSGIFVIIGIVFGVFGLITKMTMFVILAVGLIGLGIASYIFNNVKLSKNQKKALLDIEKELPRFVAYLNMNMAQNTETMLSLLERYTSENEMFDNELSMTIADAKTSSFDSAITRWDQRVNSDKLKQITHGLIAANNGDDVKMYFAMLERDMSAYWVSYLRSNIQTIPARMRVPKILMYAAVAIAMFYPLIMQIVESFRDVFT